MGRRLFDFTGSVLDSYWIPLAGSDELFVHYGADITQWASESLLPKQCAGERRLRLRVIKEFLRLTQ